MNLGSSSDPPFGGVCQRKRQEGSDDAGELALETAVQNQWTGLGVLCGIFDWQVAGMDCLSIPIRRQVHAAEQLLPAWIGMKTVKGGIDLEIAQRALFNPPEQQAEGFILIAEGSVGTRCVHQGQPAPGL